MVEQINVGTILIDSLRIGPCQILSRLTHWSVSRLDITDLHQRATTPDISWGIFQSINYWKTIMRWLGYWLWSFDHDGEVKKNILAHENPLTTDIENKNFTSVSSKKFLLSCSWFAFTSLNWVSNCSRSCSSGIVSLGSGASGFSLLSGK